MKPRVFATLLSLSLAPTYAGVIVDFSPPAVGGGLGVAAAPRVATPNPGNDNPAGAGASPNVVEITKRFDHVAEIDMEFRVRNTGASTEYFFTDTVTNNTGVDWTDFHFELGFGTGANFVRSGLLDFLDFDCPIPGVPAPTSGVFARLAHHCNTIDWDMGVVKAGAMTVFTFSIDTPDMLAALFDNANPADTIHRSKAVGEPPLLLAFSAFLAIRDAVSAVGGHRTDPPLRAPATAEGILDAIDAVRPR